MSYLNFIAEVWETRLEYFRTQATIFQDIVNTDYEGQITGVDCEVRINTVGNVTLKNYTKNIDLEVEELEDAQLIMKVDQSKYWGIKVHNVDVVQENINRINEASADAGYRVALAQDTHVLSKYADAGMTYGTSATPIEIDSDGVHGFFAHVNRLFDEADLPRIGRWITIPPWLYEKMVLAEILKSTDNTGVIANGVVGNFFGFQLRISNNIATVETSKYKLLAGIGRLAISFANAYTDTKAESVPKQFAEQVLGLHVYGAKVLRPDYLMCITATEKAES